MATQIQVGNSAPAPGQPEISKEFGYFRDSWSDVFALRSYSTPCKFFWSTYILLSLLALQNSQEPKPHNLFYLTLSLNVFNLYLFFSLSYISTTTIVFAYCSPSCLLSHSFPLFSLFLFFSDSSNSTGKMFAIFSFFFFHLFQIHWKVKWLVESNDFCIIYEQRNFLENFYYLLLSEVISGPYH